MRAFTLCHSEPLSGALVSGMAAVAFSRATVRLSGARLDWPKM